MSKTISISYDLKPPVETAVPDSHQTSKTYEYAVPVGGSQRDYYEALRGATVQAKAQIGTDLTVWRDAVGTRENAKEPKKEHVEGDDGDEEDEEGIDE